MLRSSIALALLGLLGIFVATCRAPQTPAGPRQTPGKVSAFDLRCEWLVDPLGIDNPRPHLTWKLASEKRGARATAYRVLCASSAERLVPGRADLWDSGPQTVGRSVQVEYDGQPLGPSRRVHWTVQVIDEQGRASAWSAPARFETGLLCPTDWTAEWIDDGRAAEKALEAHYEDDPAPHFRRTFVVDGRVERARLYVSGLGWYEAWINGRRVGDRQLDPLWTSYSKRVLYSTYDVTELLRSGRNAIGAILGKGWYDPLPMRMWGRLNLREHLQVGRPRLLAQLEIDLEDGSRQLIATDEQWTSSSGPILRDSVFLGEVYDARRELGAWSEAGYDAAGWTPARLAPKTLGRLRSQDTPAIRARAPLPAQARHEIRPGVWIFDLGQNFAGWARLDVEGPAGTRVRLRYGELLHADGSLNPLTSVAGQIKGEGVGGPGAPTVAEQQDTYILKGGGPEQWTPRFTFHGFRFVELTGYPGEPPLEAISGIPLACDLESVGSFESSSERLGQIDAMVRRTFLSNLFGVQSDCPHRERFGYGGDIVSTAEAFMTQLDMAAFYKKTVRDFADDADPHGCFPMTAPYVGIGYGGVEEGGAPIGWAVVHPVLLSELLRWYGDESLVREQYASARRWVEHLRTKAEDSLMDQGLSDHETLEEKPVRTTSSSFYLRAARILSELAGSLGLDPDRRRYSALASEIEEAIASELVALGTGRVGRGGQAAQAIALSEDLLPDIAREAAFRRLVENPQLREGRLATGIFGTPGLLDALSENGRSDKALELVLRDEFPGWGHMLTQGATTLWEHWALSENTYSHNHPMFGSVSAWMVQWLAGLAPAPDAIGFDRVILQPQPVAGLERAGVSYESVRGPLRIAWTVADSTFNLEVELPPNVTAELRLPTACVAESLVEGEESLASSQNIRQLGSHRLRLESGSYRFQAELAREGESLTPASAARR